MDAAPGQLRRTDDRPPLWTPLACLLLGTVAIRWLDLDPLLARWFHGFGWFFQTQHGWLGWIYRLAPLPSLLLAGVALVTLVVAAWSRWARRRWRAAAFLVALMALGPGLLVNGILKDYTGRPRPYQVEAFGGRLPYRQALQLGPPGEGYSFPSGHAAVAFYLMAPFFVCWRTRRRCAWAVLGLGVAWGLLVGVVRMLQGGHFASDVLWAAGVVYLLAWVLWRLLSPDRPPHDGAG